ncbi:MAG TPA: biotin carboxyl carrier domain-containing protein [Pseudomonas sp.]|jgi:acetyl-CoA carboxylase biotin carboxyl carrier protein|uniref:Biotin carboxyl carrier protein of acetyl-CoA carboxylase n=1 Tax=Pseudomonas helleri TaxID=1608996 RepID=A0A0J6M2H7_9PSED|nr:MULTISPECIES: acetyl-CoA carboxylase [Pseudomonas]KMN11747.1 acetyl-COA carboxylase [Pseudomonas helleri]KMN20771.1 acetyl-COA carboxylase [Pseudomonas helleri]MCU1756900.1 acetyl-CoA carboxylase [Pseudomonas helleri]MQT37329.1 biotin carboxyl carrier domain-containing protein [Pseudomonas helleri]MQT61352.1 biotin carboxyl carrier domain-containing protein [Pseudomonas sp. FSL R10-0399]
MAEHTVITPLPGTFYRKASPDSDNFVEVGAQVTADTVIGLIEVMKQFSELTAGAAGRVSAFLVEDGDPIEPGQVIATLDHE